MCHPESHNGLMEQRVRKDGKGFRDNQTERKTFALDVRTSNCAWVDHDVHG